MSTALLLNVTILVQRKGKSWAAENLFREVFGWDIDGRAQENEDPFPIAWNLVSACGQPGLRFLEVGDTLWERTSTEPGTWPLVALSVPDAEEAAAKIKIWAGRRQITVKSAYDRLRRVFVTLESVAARLWLISSDPVIWRRGIDWNRICRTYIPEHLAANRVLTIVLPPAEYARLRDGGMEDLRIGIPQDAAELLRLFESYSVTIEGKVVERPVLLLCRTGRCG